MKHLRPYLDARLALFVLLAFGASIISSHGAWLFFGYLVDPWLAGVFIVVVALGIIGLDAAGTLERGWRRVPYYAGMTVFLILETLANYFAGQSTFVARIVAKLATNAPESDLLTIARSNPAITRALVILFLSMASIAVALFTFAAATRFAQLRSGAADRPRTLLGRLRARYSTVVRALRSARAMARSLRTELVDLRSAYDQICAQSATQAQKLEDVRSQSAHRAEQSTRQLEDVRTELEDVRNQSARLRIELETSVAERDQVRTERETLRSERDLLRSQSAAAEREAETLRSQSAAQAARVRTAEDEAERLRAQLAQQSAELSALSAASQLDVRSIAQAFRDSGVALRTIGEALNVSEKTIRNWTHDPAAGNGHLKEAA